MTSIKAIIGERPTITVERQSSVTDAARVMADRHIGAVPVVDDTRLVGIFSERDVLTRVVAAGRDPDRTTIEEHPDVEVKQLRGQEDVILSTYGWVDKNAGIVRIPIVQAMDRVLEKGLPVRKEAQKK